MIDFRKQIGTTLLLAAIVKLIADVSTTLLSKVGAQSRIVVNGNIPSIGGT